MDLMDRMDRMDNVGAPVFALTGYAVASHGIPRGFAVPLGGGARGGQMCRRSMRAMLATVVCRLRGCDACVGPVGPVGPVGQVGASRYTPWVGGAAVEWDAGGRYAAGVCLFDGNGGVRAAGA